METCGCTPRDVDAFYIAGGFGARVNLQSAARLGLFPAALLPKARALGNAALGGAALLLQDMEKEAALRHILAAAQLVDLAGNAAFMDRYVEAMGFA